MVKKIFVFETDGIRSSCPMEYEKEPTKEQVINDMKQWFFENHYMWFAVRENGKETNLGDY